jgi:hypothetical protein
MKTLGVTRRLSDEDVYTSLCAWFQMFNVQGAAFACAYQWRDGPTDDGIDRFGLHTADGTPKRQAAALKDWKA